MGLLYAPFHAAAYLATSDGGEPVIPWDSAFRDTFPWAFEFAGPDGVYVTYGRVAPFVFLGFAAGLLALAAHFGTEGTRVLKGSFYALLTTQALLVPALAVEYYTPFLEEAFLFAFPIFLLGILAWITFSIAALRANTNIPKTISWNLLAGAVLIVPLIALFGHLPLALAGLYVAMLRIGILVQARPDVATTVRMPTSTGMDET